MTLCRHVRLADSWGGDRLCAWGCRTPSLAARLLLMQAQPTPLPSWWPRPRPASRASDAFERTLPTDHRGRGKRREARRQLATMEASRVQSEEIAPQANCPQCCKWFWGGGACVWIDYGTGGSSMDSSLRRVLRHLPFACPARAGSIVGLSWRVMMIRRKTAPGIRLGYFPEENSHGAFGEGHSVVRGSDLCCVRAHGRCPTSFECRWV